MNSAPNLDPKILENYSLRWDDAGVIRVGATRIPLDLIAEAYGGGQSPEETAYAYDTLALADVYAAIAFLLKYPTESEAYLSSRRQEAAELRATAEAVRPRLSRRELLERQTALRPDHAASRH